MTEIVPQSDRLAVKPAQRAADDRIPDSCYVGDGVGCGRGEYMVMTLTLGEGGRVRHQRGSGDHGFRVSRRFRNPDDGMAASLGIRMISVDHSKGEGIPIGKRRHRLPNGDSAHTRPRP